MIQIPCVVKPPVFSRFYPAYSIRRVRKRTMFSASSSLGVPPSPNAVQSSLTPESTLVDRAQKTRGKLPKETTDFLKDWLHRHAEHPYPTEEEKKQMCAETGLTMSQISNWMINVRTLCNAFVPAPLS